MYPTEYDRCPSCFVQLAPGAECEDPVCAADAVDRSMNDLPLGTVLNDQFRVGRVLGRGGFGITYLGWDERLHNRRAIKECFPNGLVRRSRDGVSVLPTNDRTKQQYNLVRELFLREARVLAHFHEQPGIVSVLSILDTNASAYLVMEFLSGETLKEYLEAQPDSRIEVSQALLLMRPVMEALTAVHEQKWLHRDVSPDNIFVTRRGQVKLLDFGAARYAAGQQTKSLPVILKEGYAPSEQYSVKGQQGTWTDVYALAATFYRAITGVTPPPALDRFEDDELAPPSQLGVEISATAEQALLSALNVKWQQRARTVPEFAALLEREEQTTQAPPVPWQVPVPPTHDSVGDYGIRREDRPQRDRESVEPPLVHPVEPKPQVTAEPRFPHADDLYGGPHRPFDGDATNADSDHSTLAQLVVSWRGAAAFAVVVVVAIAVFLLYPSAKPTEHLTPLPPEMGLLVIDASPWASVERVVDAAGKEQTLPDTATPLAVRVAAGQYKVTLHGPPPAAERREIVVNVPPNATEVMPVASFGEIKLNDYFKEQTRAGQSGGTR